MMAINQLRQLIRLLKHTYMPGSFGKVYGVAILLGAVTGGFAGGMIAAGMAAGQYVWVILLSIVVGAFVGTFLALQLVPHRQGKKSE